MPEVLPKRRLQMRLDIQADSISELSDALRNIGIDLEIEGREEREVTSGGWGSGYHYSLTCDPDMDGDIYRAELQQWMEQRKEARNAD